MGAERHGNNHFVCGMGHGRADRFWHHFDRHPHRTYFALFIAPVNPVAELCCGKADSRCESISACTLKQSRLGFVFYFLLYMSLVEV